MNGSTLFVCLVVIGGGFGMLWAWLAINEMGWLEAIERAGLHVAAWARSQKWAKGQRVIEYQMLRGAMTAELVPVGRRHAE